jgi:hypothetical protein
MRKATAHMAMVTILVCMPLGPLGCSEYLMVEFLNQSGRELEICSLGADSSEECKTAKTGEAVRHKVRVGSFRIAGDGLTWHYQLDQTNLPEGYFPRYGDPILLLVDEDLYLFLIGHGRPRDSVAASQQPAGFPIQPQT